MLLLSIEDLFPFLVIMIKIYFSSKNVLSPLFAKYWIMQFLWYDTWLFLFRVHRCFFDCSDVSYYLRTRVNYNRILEGSFSAKETSELTQFSLEKGSWGHALHCSKCGIGGFLPRKIHMCFLMNPMNSVMISDSRVSAIAFMCVLAS